MHGEKMSMVFFRLDPGAAPVGFPVPSFPEDKNVNGRELVEGQDNQIIEVVQKGYLLCGKLLCPAKVKIGKKVENNK